MTDPSIEPEDLHNLVSLSDPRFSPDGQWLAYVRSEISRETNSYKRAIWLAPTGGGSQAARRPRPFTSGEKADTTPRWSPDGHWLAFASDRGDDESRSQIYLIPTDGGEARRLTEMENGAEDPAWSPDGRQLAFRSRLDAEELAQEIARQERTDDEPAPEASLDPEEIERRAREREKREEQRADPRVIRRFSYRAGTKYHDERTAHIYLLEIDPETGEAQGKPHLLTRDERNYADIEWLPDGNGLLATVDRQPGTDDLFYHPDLVRVPLDGGEPQILTGPETADHNARSSPDGQWIAYNSLPVAEITTANANVMLMPASGGEPRAMTADLDAHARDILWSPDGGSVCFLVSKRGRIDLRRVRVGGGPVETLVTADREMLAYDLSADGQRAAFLASTDRAPYDLYVADLGAAGEAAERRLTTVNAAWLADRELGDVEDHWFESADGTSIQGWIIRPPGFDPAQQYPLILSIHGGPHVMWSRHEATMWHEWQALASAGYVVFACNPRGSDGYGRDFRAGALGRWGEADLPDLMSGVESVVAQGYVDPERLGVTGGSYGGFMTAWVIGHDDRFRAAVAQRGVYDMTSFYSTSDIPLLTEWEFAGTPWGEPDRLWRASPLAYVEQIHTPLLLIHSEKDFRAPIPAAEGLFVALRRLRREVEMVRYPRDGHELSRSGEPKHRVDRLQRILGWFDRYVKA